MIIGTKKKILVCTPTKVGSESLELDLFSNNVAERVPGLSKHATSCDIVVPKRYLLVRHPLERFTSIFFFIGKNKSIVDSSGLFEAARSGDINLFCERYLVAKKSVWSLQLSEYVSDFKPTKIFKLENGLDKLLSEFGLDRVTPSHINRTTHGGLKNLEMSRKNYEKIIKLHKESLKIYGE
jgi:hypothetical protein